MTTSTARLAWVVSRWHAFWFAPASAQGIGVCSFLFFGCLLWVAWPAGASSWAEIPETLLMPIDAFVVLRLPIAPSWLLAWMAAPWAIALALCCLGLVVVLGVLACARTAGGFSLGRLLRGRAAAPPSGEYQWPLHIVQLAMCWVFFAAGVAKLRRGGLEWMSAESFRAILLLYHYQLDRDLPSIGLDVADIPWLCTLLAVATVGLELGAPLAFVSRRARSVLIPGLLLFQLANAFLVGVHRSVPFSALYAFWVPWDRWFEGRRLAPSPSPCEPPPPCPAAAGS